MDLFDYMRASTQEQESPLASRMRPTTLDEVVGQKHIIGKDKLLYRAIKADQLGSIIFYGPPGTGKTTLAKVIANTTSASFRQINATVAVTEAARLHERSYCLIYFRISFKDMHVFFMHFLSWKVFHGFFYHMFSRIIQVFEYSCGNTCQHSTANCTCINCFECCNRYIQHVCFHLHPFS